jgi:hypothetical protein
MTNLPIPAADPIPLPAPVWLLKTLLLVTFFLHLLLMNCAVGGGVIALISAVRGNKDRFAAGLARKLVGILPIVTAFTITLGVAALLFAQVLYGQLLYSSSILMGVAWIAVIPLLIIAYYGYYWASLKLSLRGLALAVVLLVVIGFIYVTNMSLMLAPDRWLHMYANSAAGLHLNTADPTFIARYLHMMLGAIAIGGLFVVALALRERRADLREWMLRNGALWFTIATAGNIVVGFWFLLALRSDVRTLFMGGSKLASALLIAGFLLPIGAIVHLLLGLSGRKPERQAIAGIGTGVLTVAVMVGVRDIVRAGYLNGIFNPAELQVQPQWSVIAIFLVLFLAGLGTLYWMLRRLATAPTAAEAKGTSAAN